MTVEFFRIDHAPPGGRTLPDGCRLDIWHPGAGGSVPPGCAGLKWWVWAAFHRTHVFGSPQYGAVLIFRSDRLVHRSPIFPKYFRFPFMKDEDIQVGDTWTEPTERGKGLAAAALVAAAQRALEPGASLWYVTTADNVASIRVARAAGLNRVGTGIRTRRFGLRLLGDFRMTAGAPD